MKLKFRNSLFNYDLKKVVVTILVTGLWLSPTQAEVILDGSLGTTGSLSGPNYQIPANIGRQIGSNLFHSFGKFNLTSLESATFTDQGSMGQINNILSRVTGGESVIDGLLQSTIPGADLYLMNPAGIVFGEHAQLDVQGSFHATTAAYLRLEDGTQFNAIPSTQDALLVTAPPKAFGFLNNNSSGIAILGSEINLPPGETLSLVANNLEIRNGMIIASEGEINLVSTQFSREIKIENNPTFSESGFLSGDITISEDSLIDVSGDRAGSIHLKGYDIKLFSSSIQATSASTSGKPIEIKANSLRLIDESKIETQTIGSGAAGSIKITAPLIEIAPGSEITSSTFAQGNAGNIDIHVTDLNIIGLDSDSITTGITSIANFASTGNAGTIDVKGIGTLRADNIIVNNTGVDPPPDGFKFSAIGLAGIASNTVLSTSGNANTVTIYAKNIELIDGGIIASSTLSSSGNAGKVIVNADHIRISGVSSVGPDDIASGIDSSAVNFLGVVNPTGNAGVIDITAQELILEKGGIISSSTLTQGDAGEVMVHVSDKISIIGNILRSKDSTGITASAEVGSTGKAGSIFVETTELLIDGTNALSFTGIGSLARVKASGDSGTTTVIATESIRLLNGGGISSATFSNGNAGDVIVETGDLLIDGAGAIVILNTGLKSETVIPSSINSNASQFSTGNAGNTQVTANTIVLSNGGLIGSQSLGTGQVGNVVVIADDILIDSDGLITASTLNLGEITVLDESGRVEIQIANSLRLQNGGRISVETLKSNAGDIFIDATNPSSIIQLSDRGQVTTSVANEEGNGGNINIGQTNQPQFLVLDGSSKIVANAKEGSGGNINISTDFLFGSSDNISASSEKGISGAVDIDSPDTDISSGLLTLTADFIDATTVLRKPCAQQSGADNLRLVVRKHEVLPQTPYALWEHIPDTRSNSQTNHSQSELSPAKPIPAGIHPLNKECSDDK